jgi:hypothetical protein
MNFYLYEILLILGAHWVADFSIQTHWQAVNKSKNNYALFKHVLTYSLSIGLIFSLFYDLKSVLVFTAINGVIHFITDFITSRLNSYFWKKGETHLFFLNVGADQLLHYMALFYTFGEIFK